MVYELYELTPEEIRLEIIEKKKDRYIISWAEVGD